MDALVDLSLNSIPSGWYNSKRMKHKHFSDFRLSCFPAFWLKLLIAISLLVLLAACATAPPPAPPPPPAPTPVPTPTPQPPAPVLTKLTVTVGKLNVREAPDAKAKIIQKVRRGDTVMMVSEEGGWCKLQLPGEKTGYVMSKYVRKKGVCPPNREMEILDEPPAVFGETSAGKVVLEARVDEMGAIQSVRMVENTTKDAGLAKLAEEDLRKMKFKPPVQNCKPTGFTYLYTKNF